MSPTRLQSSLKSMHPSPGEQAAQDVPGGETQRDPMSTGAVLPFSASPLDAAGASPAAAFKKVRILGIRGIPAAHGGFETFTEYLALYLV